MCISLQYLKPSWVFTFRSDNSVYWGLFFTVFFFPRRQGAFCRVNKNVLLLWKSCPIDIDWDNWTNKSTDATSFKHRCSCFIVWSQKWPNKTFFFFDNCLGFFTSSVCLLVLPVLTDSRGCSSAWRYASLRRLILQPRLNGFPLEGLWLIRVAYSILCGHCSRKVPPYRTTRTIKPNTLVWDIVQRGLCMQSVLRWGGVKRELYLAGNDERNYKSRSDC